MNLLFWHGCPHGRAALILVWQFVKAILLAVAVVILLKPLYNWLLDKRWIEGSERKATGLTMMIFVLLIAIPAMLIVGGATPSQPPDDQAQADKDQQATQESDQILVAQPWRPLPHSV